MVKGASAALACSNGTPLGLNSLKVGGIDEEDPEQRDRAEWH